MSINTRRILAALACVVIAALTALGVGVLAGGGGCRVVVQAAPSAGGTTPPATDGQLGDAESATASPPPPAAAPVASCLPTDSPAVPAGTLGFAGAALAALAVMVALSTPAPGTGRRAGGTAPGPAGASATAAADRAALVAAVIYVRDRITSRALGERLGSALATAGVRALQPAGARFDAAHHEAGGTAPTTDPALAGTIAAVEVPGYADRDGRTLRVPVVTVYRISDNAQGEPR